MEPYNLKKTALALYLAVVAIWIAVVMCSCTSMKKMKSLSYKKTDSSVVSLTHKQGTSLTDSATVKKTDQEYKNSVDIVFDDDTAAIQQAIELAGPERLPYLHTVTIAGKQISSTRAIKSININLAGKLSTIDLTHLITKDSGQADIDQSVQVSKVDKETEKHVERTGGAGLFIWIGVLLALTVFFIYKKYFA